MMVNNAYTYWCEENPNDKVDLLEHWDRVNASLSMARKMRNWTAHGSVTVYTKNDTHFVRLTPPVFDPKLSRLIAKGTIPGVAIDEVNREIQHVIALRSSIELMATTVTALREQKMHALRQICSLLEENLTQIDNLFPAAPSRPRS